MELRNLTIFATVAKLGSVSAAARELNYVQSNVTMHIKTMEEKLQTPLFHRQPTGMVLNAEGRKLLTYVEEILQQTEALKHAFLDNDEPSGMLRLGTVEIVSKLPTIIASYYEANPFVDISLQAGVTEKLVQKVLDYELDGAFVSGSVKHALLARKLINEERLVVISAKPTFAITDLVKTPLLVANEGCGYRAKLSLWLMDEGVQPQRIMEFNIMETILQSVALGLGVTVVPYETVCDRIAKEEVYAHALPKVYEMNTTWFIYRKDSYITRTLQSFLTHLS